MKKAFLLILSAICLNSCHALVIRPLTEATVAVIGAPFYAVGKLLPKKDEQDYGKYREGYRAYKVEEYKDRIDKLMSDILQRKWEKTTFFSGFVDTDYHTEQILLPKGLVVEKDVLVDKETGYGLPVHFLKDEYPCYFDRKKGIYDLKSKEEYFIKGNRRDYFRIESETEKGNLLEKMILEKNNVQRGCKQ